MKSVQALLSFSLLLMLANSSAAQAPQPQPDQPEMKYPDLLRAKPLKEDSKDNELRKLLKARYNEALAEVQVLHEMYTVARVSLDSVADAEQRLVRAGLELCDTPAAKVALLTQYVELTKRTERIAQARFESTRTNSVPLHRARYQRLDAEIQLLKAGGKLKKTGLPLEEQEVVPPPKKLKH